MKKTGSCRSGVRDVVIWSPSIVSQGSAAARKKTANTVLVSGIGCSGRLPYFIDSFGFHTLHGRALPTATGIKRANPELDVIVIGGDGDGFGIGGGHVPHTARRNVDITCLILDNGVYALTKGHSSPTTEAGQRTPGASGGEDSQPLDIIGMLLAYRTSFVAGGFSGDRPRLTELITEAILHKGFSTIKVFSPCPTYNDVMTFECLKSRLHKIPEEFNGNNLMSAIQLNMEHNGMLDGILYKASDQPALPRTKSGDNGKTRFLELVKRYA